FLCKYKIHHKWDAECIHGRVYFFFCFGESFDGHICEDTCADASCDSTCKNREDNHDEGTECFHEISKVNMADGRNHAVANKNQCRASCGIRDHQEQWRCKDRHKEESRSRQSSQTSPSACFYSSGRFNESRDGRTTGRSSHTSSDRIYNERPLDFRVITVFIQ